jgi:predicted DNA-binding protein YlxM (UPF0122 family)
MDALEMTLLFDYYGSMLTDKQKLCFDMRYNQDLSLGEIAELMGVSRQAVCDNLTRTEALLRKMEANIGCIRRGQKLRKIAALIQESAGQLLSSSDETTSELARRILSAAEEIEE